MEHGTQQVTTLRLVLLPRIAIIASDRSIDPTAETRRRETLPISRQISTGLLLVRLVGSSWPASRDDPTSYAETVIYP